MAQTPLHRITLAHVHSAVLHNWVTAAARGPHVASVGMLSLIVVHLLILLIRLLRTSVVLICYWRQTLLPSVLLPHHLLLLYSMKSRLLIHVSVAVILMHWLWLLIKIETASSRTFLLLFSADRRLLCHIALEEQRLLIPNNGRRRRADHILLP